MTLAYWERMLEFWHKYMNRSWKKGNVVYDGGIIHKKCDVDIIPITAINLIREEYDLPGKEWDDKILPIARKVRRRFEYTTDNDAYGKVEHWAKASDLIAELLQGNGKIQDDCDGISMAIYATLVLCGVPYYRLRIAAGLVYPFTKYDGHAYVLYLPKKYVNTWFVVESSYNPTRADRHFLKTPQSRVPWYDTPWWMITKDQSFTKRHIKLKGKDFLNPASEV